MQTRDQMKYANRQALVTGASSGIGEAFARELARRGMAVLLTALPSEQERLETIADELRQQHGARAAVVPLDLTQPDAPERLRSAADALGFEPDLLINSAGIGAGGPFAEADLARQLTMLQLNVAALVGLCGHYLPRMVARKNGAIINVASTSAFEPMPYLAAYAASKAFVLRFSEALWAENHQHHVRVIALCPGPVETAFHRASGSTGQKTGARSQIRRRYLPVEVVVQAGLDGLEKDQPVVVRRASRFSVPYHVVTAVGKLTTKRRRLLTSERINKWYFEEP